MSGDGIPALPPKARSRLASVKPVWALYAQRTISSFGAASSLMNLLPQCGNRDGRRDGPLCTAGRGLDQGLLVATGIIATT